MAEVVELHGLEDVRKALKKLPKEVARKELNKSIRAGAKLILAAAKARAPRGDKAFHREASGSKSRSKIKRKAWTHYIGTLANSIVIRSEKRRFLLDTARLRIGVLHSRDDPNIGAWYWRFVEFDHVTKNGTHVPARPFLVPAFESTKYIANKAIRTALLKGVVKQANKVRSRRR